MQTTPEANGDAVVQVCASCGTRNRIPRARLHDDPVCGACKQKVFPRGPVPCTDVTWSSQVEDSALPVVVDFWAPWCGPCRAVAPHVEQIAHEYAGRIKVVKINTDECPSTAARFGIRSIPTLMLFRGPRELGQLVGLQPKAEIEAWIHRYA
jgi:thioredoxin 2